MIATLFLAAAATADPLGVARAVSDGCASPDRKEIVVCASRDPQRRYSLPKLSHDYDRRHLDAATDIAPGVGAKIRVVSVEFPGGVKSNRVMLTVGTKF